MERQVQHVLVTQRQKLAAELFQDILRMMVERQTDEAVVRILVAVGDLYRMREFPVPSQFDDWKRGLTPQMVRGAIACALGHGPQGLFVHPEVFTHSADVDMSILNRDRLQSFLIALGRITLHHVELLQGSRFAQLDSWREAFDVWLGRAVHSFRLTPSEIAVKRGDRAVIESEPAWVLYVCHMKRPKNASGDRE